MWVLGTPVEEVNSDWRFKEEVGADKAWSGNGPCKHYALTMWRDLAMYPEALGVNLKLLAWEWSPLQGVF